MRCLHPVRRDLFHSRDVFEALQENTTAADRALQSALGDGRRAVRVCGDGAWQAG